MAQKRKHSSYYYLLLLQIGCVRDCACEHFKKILFDVMYFLFHICVWIDFADLRYSLTYEKSFKSLFAFNRVPRVTLCS